MCACVCGLVAPFPCQVVRVKRARPLVLELPFRCSGCGDEQVQPLVDGVYEPPPFCPNRCKRPRFAPVRRGALCVDYQRFVLQEQQQQGPGGSSAFEAGRVPRSIEVHAVGPSHIITKKNDHVLRNTHPRPSRIACVLHFPQHSSAASEGWALQVTSPTFRGSSDERL